jgi:hypothetical protein
MDTPNYLYVVTLQDDDDASGESSGPVRVFPTREAAERWIDRHQDQDWKDRIAEEQLEFDDEDEADDANPLKYECHMVPYFTDGETE